MSPAAKAITPAVDTPAMVDLAAVRREVQEEIERSGLSQAGAAKEAGLSASILNQFLREKYPGDNGAVAETLMRWLNTRRDGATIKTYLPEAPKWIETPTARRIMDALTYAQLAGDIACIYGGAGLGKTSAIEHYAETHSAVWVVTATPATASVGVILEEIALALGMRDFALHPARLHRDVVKRLRGTQGLLVVDEAQHLTIQALEAIRSLHDATRLGLALCGNATVYGRLTGGARSDNFAQLFSRIGKRVALTRPAAADVGALARAYRVDGAEEIAALQEIAKRPGALRSVAKTLRLAAMYAAGKVPPVEIRIDEIRAAWSELGGEVIDA